MLSLLNYLFSKYTELGFYARVSQKNFGCKKNGRKKRSVAYVVSARIFLRHIYLIPKFGRKESGCKKMGVKKEFTVYIKQSDLFNRNSMNICMVEGFINLSPVECILRFSRLLKCVVRC